MLGSIERATRTPKREHVDALDTVLDTGGALRRLWEDMHRQRYVPDWFKDALKLEQRAQRVSEYEPYTMPGLLQTLDYARAMMQARRTVLTAERIDQIAQARVERLPSVHAPLLWFVVGEPVLRKVVGGETIMKEQLKYIAHLTDTGRIQLQILPLERLHPGLNLPFRILAMNDSESVVYVEHALGGEVYDAPERVSETNILFGAIQAESLPFSDSRDLLNKVIEEL